MIDILSRNRLRLFAQHLRAQQRPVLQEADLAVAFLLALRDAGDLEIPPEPAQLRRGLIHVRHALLEFGGLEAFKVAGDVHGYLVGISLPTEAEEALCSVDPFVFVSHLSAMAWHGLTDRIPTTLFATRPSATLWKNLSEARLHAELRELFPLYLEAGFPAYRPFNASKLYRRPLNIWSSRRLDDAFHAAFKKVAEGRVRLATVARCFLDMVREPELCGGIHHVIEVYEEHASNHVETILAEVDRHGNRIEQARVGYLLERADPAIESHPILAAWAKKVQRGGSRKLDPSADYADRYSKRWALSINV